MPKESQKIIDHLEAIRIKHGDLNDLIVVDEARDPKHPLHHRFEWDDSIAGERYRLSQARELLRVTYKPDPDAPTTLRAFVAIKGEGVPKSSWTPTQEALEDPVTRKILLSQMLRDWEIFQARYEHMEEFADLVIREARLRKAARTRSLRRKAAKKVAAQHQKAV